MSSSSLPEVTDTLQEMRDLGLEWCTEAQFAALFDRIAALQAELAEANMRHDRAASLGMADREHAKELQAELEAAHEVYQRNITDEYQRRIKAEAELEAKQEALREILTVVEEPFVGRYHVVKLVRAALADAGV